MQKLWKNCQAPRGLSDQTKVQRTPIYVRDMQRFLRREGQDAFQGEKSFMIGKSSLNQRIEHWWSFLRKECTDYWINLFHTLKDNGDFDGEFMDRNLLLFCFLGLFQVKIEYPQSFHLRNATSKLKNVYIVKIFVEQVYAGKNAKYHQLGLGISRVQISKAAGVLWLRL